MHIDVSTIVFIAGVVVLSTTLMLRTRLRYQREAKRAAERRAAALAAKEAERKRQAALAEPSKVKLASGSHAALDRVSLGPPHDPAFAAGITPRSIAKWETEIHQIGRQMIGQLDSKSVVLQTLTREANRAANRLEILVDHLETLLKNSVAAQKPVTVPEDAAEHSNRIPREAATQTVEAFADVLEESESEPEQFQEPAKEPIPPLTVVKAETAPDPIPMVSLSPGPHRMTDRPKGMEFSAVPPPPIPSAARQPGLAVASLFDNSLVPLTNEPVPSLGSSVPAYQTPLIEQSAQPRSVSESLPDTRFISEAALPLDKRRQVAMLTDYGYTPKQIAQDLNLTVGEVELMINLRN